MSSTDLLKTFVKPAKFMKTKRCFQVLTLEKTASI